MPRLALVAPFVVAAMAATALSQPAAAGDVHVGPYPEAPAWVMPSGPQIYYGRHYTHVPAYPAPYLEHAYPVPVFSGPRQLPAVGYADPAHVEWCYARYRSYRLSDNSFQPDRGVRRACRSPYS